MRLKFQLKVTNTGEFNLRPFTRLFLGSPLVIYTQIVIFSTIIFSGLLGKKASQNNMNLMIDATPIENWQLLFSKIGSISLIQLTQLLLFILIGITIQIINGYYNFEVSLYIFHILLLVFPILFVWNVVSQFVYTLISNLFFGLFILSCLWIGAQSLEQIGIQSNILKFNLIN